MAVDLAAAIPTWPIISRRSPIVNCHFPVSYPNDATKSEIDHDPAWLQPTLIVWFDGSHLGHVRHCDRSRSESTRREFGSCRPIWRHCISAVCRGAFCPSCGLRSSGACGLVIGSAWAGIIGADELGRSRRTLPTGRTRIDSCRFRARSSHLLPGPCTFRPALADYPSFVAWQGFLCRRRHINQPVALLAGDSSQSRLRSKLAGRSAIHRNGLPRNLACLGRCPR